MELELSILQEIAEEYEFPISNILEYYEAIKDYHCVIAMDEQYLIDCLNLIVQDRASMSYIISQYDPSSDLSFEEYKQEKYKSLEYSISDGLYRIYEEKAIPYLSKEYKYINGIGPVKTKIRSYQE